MPWPLRAVRKSRANVAKVNQHVTVDRRPSSHHCPIIQAIEQGADEFKLPWHPPAGSVTRHQHSVEQSLSRHQRGVALDRRHRSRLRDAGVWGTYKRLSEAGCQVRKGEKVSMIDFYEELDLARGAAGPDDADATKKFWMARRMSGA